ncbi:TPA: baseplate J/gp47 family protein, partial [Klebsiella pneumoniae]|nr:baseplate J/gp47 family protein [Klebsiella pneumoniae]
MAVIDLSQLPAPDVVETLDFEAILAERKATLISLYPEDEQEAVARTLTLESDPLVKYLEENAYREVILRQRINEAAKAGMVAYAIKNDLDQLAANNNVERLVIIPGDDTQIPPVAAVMESDSDLRQRVPAAFEGMSVAGPVGAYEYHALSSDGRVADASAFSPSPAEVVVTILARDGDGTAPEDLLQVVGEALNDEAVRPVADRVSVRSAEIVPYEIDAVLYVYPGPAKEPILSAAKAQGAAYINEQRRLGRDVRLSAIYAALHVQGVQRVELMKP